MSNGCCRQPPNSLPRLSVEAASCSRRRGSWVVQFWVEHPVVIRERLQLDYTQVQVDGFEGNHSRRHFTRKKVQGVPAGHTFYISFEYNYNKEIRNFQTVFRTDFSTRQVYEEGAKEVTLSILSVVNQLIRSGCTLEEALRILVPEAYKNHPTLSITYLEIFRRGNL